MIVGVAATLVSLYYYLAVVRAMYFRSPVELQLMPAGGSPPREVTLQVGVALAVVVTVGSFFAVQPLIENCEEGRRDARLLAAHLDVSADVPGPEAGHVRAVAERLVRSLCAQPDEARPVGRGVCALAVVEDREPREHAYGKGRIAAHRDDTAELGAVAVVDVQDT
jgi:hypothetical protein